MKNLRPTWITAFLLVALAPLGQAAGNAVQEPAADSPRMAHDAPTGKPSQKGKNARIRRDAQQLQAAAKVLARRGYKAEALRLKDVIQEMRAGAAQQDVKPGKAVKRLEARAKKLLKLDIQEQPTRIAMLVLLADGYRAAGYEGGETALRWFSQAGRDRAQEGSIPPLPAVLAGSGGSLMERLRKFVEDAERPLAKLGSKKAAYVSKVLGEFYVQRDAGTLAEPSGAQGPSTAARPVQPEPVQSVSEGPDSAEPGSAEPGPIDPEWNARLAALEKRVAELRAAVEQMKAELKAAKRSRR